MLKFPLARCIKAAAALLAAAIWLGVLNAPTIAAGLPAAQPSEVGLDGAKVAELAKRMQRYVDDKVVAGAVTLVAKDGKVVHLGTIGKADLEAEKAMQPDTIFAIASMTKPIAGAAVMVLVDEGKLSLDDPVSKYIPEFKNARLKSGEALQREITLRHVLTHTSGLGGEQQNMGTLAETAQKLASRGLDFQPGERWQYSPGISVAGRVVEVASGMSFDEFVDKRLFEPLGMQDTTFNPSGAQRARQARLYKQGDDKKSLVATTHWIFDTNGRREPNPSGGLFSTAGDIARFYQMVLNKGELDGKRVLSEKAVDTMISVQSGDVVTGFTPGNGWGVGWCVVRKPQGVTASLSPGSAGHGGAFGTQSWLDPQRKMIFILMIQRQGLPNADASDLRRDLQQLAVEAMVK